MTPVGLELILVAADPRLRPRGHSDRYCISCGYEFQSAIIQGRKELNYTTGTEY